MKLPRILLGESRPLALLTILFGVLSGASSAALVALINRALTQGAQSSLASAALPFVGVALAAMLARIGSQLMLNRLQQGVLKGLRLRLSQHLLSASLRTLEEAGSHRMLTSLMQDLHTLSVGVSTVPELFINGAVVVSGLAYLAWLSWPLFLALVGIMVVGQLTYTLPAAVADRYQLRAREQSTALSRLFLSMSSGAKELRLNRLRRRAFFDASLTPAVQEMRALSLRSEDFYAFAGTWGSFLNTLTLGLLLLVGPRVTVLSPMELTSTVLVILYLQPFIGGIVSMYPNIRRGEVALAQIEKLGLSLAPEQGLRATLSEEPRQAAPTFERLDLVGVTHVYRNERDGEQFTLGPIDLSLRRGELLFLVGGNGSGKTTLAKVLCGLYPPLAGELRVDGTPVPPERLDDYRQHFASVFFDFHLFERLLGLSSPELLKQAAGYLTQLHLEQKVRIGEDGVLSTVALSQGQRKRLALLVAYLEDRPIYLFDEWAADQDPHFKEVFYKQLLPDLKARGKAVVVISHDDRYFHLADRLVRIESGQLISDSRPGAPPAPHVVSA
ncbi:MAG TPA: cyclic peptide export ABC transporter [Myxococcus sp.]|nr:cyclic peptide export ABC transporter [Myxococcus sp.]